MFKYIVFLIAYFLGAIPWAFWAGKMKNIDIRKHGSGNIGTTNAFRILGPAYGTAVLVGDALKGAIAAYLGLVFFGPWGGIIGGLLAIIGHSWNPFFGFKPSGKGVAAGFGIIIVLIPKIMILAILVFLLVVIFTRYVSMGSVAGALTVLLCVFLFNEHLAYKVFALIAVSVVVIRHRTNFRRVLNGTENKFGQSRR